MIIWDLTEPSPSKPSTVIRCNEIILTREEILQRISKKRWTITGDLVEFPPLNCKDDLAAWIARVEEHQRDVIPRSQWADGAILYLADCEALNMLMRQQRARRMGAGLDIWIWEDFQEYLSQVLGNVLIQTRPRLCILTDSSSRGKRSAAPFSNT